MTTCIYLYLQGGGGETDWPVESQWMGLLKNFKRWKKIVIISGNHHVIRSLLPLPLTRPERILVALYCTVLQCTHSTGCNARFSVESYNQIIIFPFPDNIFLPFLSQLCKLGRREGRARNSDIVMTLIAAHSIWNNYRLASEMTEIQSHWVCVWTVTGREWSHFNKIITVLQLYSVIPEILCLLLAQKRNCLGLRRVNSQTILIDFAWFDSSEPFAILTEYWSGLDQVWYNLRWCELLMSTFHDAIKWSKSSLLFKWFR